MARKKRAGIVAGTLAAGAIAIGLTGVALAQTAPSTTPGPGAWGMGSMMGRDGGMMGFGGMFGQGQGTGPGAMMGRMMGMMGRGMTGGPMGMMGMMAGVDADQHFIQEMIPHHEDAITMARLALQQAERPEIKALAEEIIRVQSMEIEQMREWYKAWYGTDVPPSHMDQMPGRGMMGMMGMHEPAALDGVKPFDKAFIEQMIPHHQMGVMMSSHLLQGVQRPELRTLLQNIISSQSAEIQQMRAWYQAWYG
jgi:uncharacterized protein (DUF305 family)